MIRAHEFKRHDTGYPLRVQLLKSDGTPLTNLSSATSLTFTMTPNAGGSPKVNNRPAVVENEAQGLVRYDFQSADTDTAGTFKGEFELVHPSYGQLSFPPEAGQYIPIIISPDLNNT